MIWSFCLVQYAVLHVESKEVFQRTSGHFGLYNLFQPLLMSSAHDQAQMTHVKSKGVHQLGQLAWIGKIIGLGLASHNETVDIFIYQSL